MSFSTTRVWQRGDTRADDILVESINHKHPAPRAPRPLRDDTKLWISGPALTPTGPRPDYKTAAAKPASKKRCPCGLHDVTDAVQRITHVQTDHVHDPDWCYGRPKSSRGFVTDLPPLMNDVARYDPFTEPDIEQPEHELAWLTRTQFDEIPTTLQMLRWHNLDGSLLTEAIEESDAGEDLELADRTSAPVMRRVEWEQEQAQNGRTTKFYLTPPAAGSDDTIDVAWWSGKDENGRPAQPDFDPIPTAKRAYAWAKTHGITASSAAAVIEDRRGRVETYGADHMYSYLKPATLRTYYGSPEARALQAQLRAPDEDPYRLAFILDDDDLHRPEQGYESKTLVNEIHDIQWEAATFRLYDWSYGDLDQYGHWRLDQHWVDVLNAAGFTNDSAITLDVDSTIELRDNERRIVLNHPRRGAPPLDPEERADWLAKNPTSWYEEWSTKRFTDYRWRDESGKRRHKRIYHKSPQPGGLNESRCDCRDCRRHFAKLAFRRTLDQMIAAFWDKRSA